MKKYMVMSVYKICGRTILGIVIYLFNVYFSQLSIMLNVIENRAGYISH